MTQNTYTKNALNYFKDNARENGDLDENGDYTCMCIHDWADTIRETFGLNKKFGSYIEWGKLAMDTEEEVIIRCSFKIGEYRFLTLTEYRDENEYEWVKDYNEMAKWMEDAPSMNVFIITKHN
jgi:hypothetical protein